jgi:hypothetical protein
LKPERKFWLELKKKTPNITWTRIENLALPGVPDLLGYNKKLSPSLLASRIFMRAIKSRSLLLAAWRLMLVARSLMLVACGLNRLVLDACCLRLEAWRLDLDRVTVFNTPFIVYFISYDPPPSLFNIWFSAGHMLHF